MLSFIFLGVVPLILLVRPLSILLDCIAVFVDELVDVLLAYDPNSLGADGPHSHFLPGQS